MQIKKELPPFHIWERVKDLFVVNEGSILFTYGDTIYNPGGVDVDDFLLEHEKTHQLQQEQLGGPDAWWEQWITDPAFRAEHEACAYGAQYHLYCERRHDRNIRAKYLHAISAALSSGMYGLKMSQQDASAAIKRRA